MPQFYHNVHQLSLFGPTTKVCSQCHIEKPLDAFYKESQNPDGRRKECIACRYIREGKDPSTRTPISEFRLPVGVSHKICNRCKEDKAIEDFPKNSSSGDGYKSICKKCDYATTKAFREANKEQHRAKCHESYIRNIERIRERAQSKEHIEHRREYWRKRRQEDPEWRQKRSEYMSRYYAERPEKAEQYSEVRRKWHAAHPTIRTQYTMHYNARKKTAIVDEVDYARIRERDGDFCYICEKTILPHHAIDFDHKIPLTRNGPHSEENIFTTHACCNRRKHNKLIEEMTPFQRRGPTD